MVAAAAMRKGVFNLTRTGIAAELTAASEQRLPPVGGRCRIATKRGVQGSEAGAVVSFLILIVVAIALFAFLKYSTTGKQIRAVSQNPIGAEVVGINVKKIYILTYGLGVALAGIAGSLLTQFYTIYPTAGASFGFRALIVVVVGGLGSIPGAFFAGIFLGLLEQMSALFISPSYSDMIVFVTFIIILVVRQVMILRRR